MLQPKILLTQGIGFWQTLFKTIFLAHVLKRVSPQNFNMFMKNKVLKHSLIRGILSIGPSGQLLKRRAQLLLIMLLRIGLHSQQTGLNGSIDQNHISDQARKQLVQMKPFSYPGYPFIVTKLSLQPRHAFGLLSRILLILDLR